MELHVLQLTGSMVKLNTESELLYMIVAQDLQQYGESRTDNELSTCTTQGTIQQSYGRSTIVLHGREIF